MTNHFKIFILLMLAVPFGATAQRTEVNPIGMTDVQNDQLFGRVRHVKEMVYKVDYSRRTTERGQFLSARTDTYNSDGSLAEQTTEDESGAQLTKTIYQYKDGVKSVSTTYDAAGTRTSQTLYAFTADNLCARMRYTDAIGITISTAEVSHGSRWAMVSEAFNDGETVVTEYFYNEDKRIVRMQSRSGDVQLENAYKIGKNGLPERCTSKTNGKRQISLFTYETDDHGNWTKRVTHVGSQPTEIVLRTIEYY